MNRTIAAAVVAASAAGYVAGRNRPLHELREWNWRNVVLGTKGGRKLNNGDAVLYMACHPVRVARSLTWSPFYRPPQPKRIVSAEEIFFKVPRND